MKAKLAILVVLLIGIFLIGCEKSQTGYATYNQPQGQPQGQYVGGGCGVSPSADYESTPIESLGAEDSVL